MLDCTGILGCLFVGWLLLWQHAAKFVAACARRRRDWVGLLCCYGVVPGADSLAHRLGLTLLHSLSHSSCACLYQSRLHLRPAPAVILLCCVVCCLLASDPLTDWPVRVSPFAEQGVLARASFLLRPARTSCFCVVDCCWLTDCTVVSILRMGPGPFATYFVAHSTLEWRVRFPLISACCWLCLVTEHFRSTFRAI